jgi:hypothetical protein
MAEMVKVNSDRAAARFRPVERLSHLIERPPVENLDYSRLAVLEFSGRAYLKHAVFVGVQFELVC